MKLIKINIINLKIKLIESLWPDLNRSKLIYILIDYWSKYIKINNNINFLFFLFFHYDLHKYNKFIMKIIIIQINYSEYLKIKNEL
jgi:hypothetical protein